MSEYLKQAFHEVCSEAKQAQQFYVVLWEHSSRYGGPEEGGWWTGDVIPVAYQSFATEEAAEAAKDAVQKMAENLSHEAKRTHDLHCLESMEWLDARGLDADYLPEPDGPSEFSVSVTDQAPEPSYGPTHYE